MHCAGHGPLASRINRTGAAARPRSDTDCGQMICCNTVFANPAAVLAFAASPILRGNFMPLRYPLLSGTSLLVASAAISAASDEATPPEEAIIEHV